MEEGAPNTLRIRPGIFDSEPDLGLKLGQATPQLSGTVPTNRHTIFDDDPTLFDCEIAQPSTLLRLKRPCAKYMFLGFWARASRVPPVCLRGGLLMGVWGYIPQTL